MCSCGSGFWVWGSSYDVKGWVVGWSHCPVWGLFICWSIIFILICVMSWSISGYYNKIAETGGAYKQHTFYLSPFWRLGKSKVKAWVDLVSGEVSLAFRFMLSSSHCVFPRRNGGGSSLLHWSHLSGLHPHALISSQRPHLLAPWPWGLDLEILWHMNSLKWYIESNCQLCVSACGFFFSFLNKPLILEQF